MDARKEISVIPAFCNRLALFADLTHPHPSGRTSNTVYAPFSAAFLACNIGIVKPSNHAFDFSFGHLPLSKWTVLATATLDTIAHHKGPCLLHKRHEQLPTHLAIAP